MSSSIHTLRSNTASLKPTPPLLLYPILKLAWQRDQSRRSDSPRSQTGAIQIQYVHYNHSPSVALLNQLLRSVTRTHSQYSRDAFFTSSYRRMMISFCMLLGYSPAVWCATACCSGSSLNHCPRVLGTPGNVSTQLCLSHPSLVCPLGADLFVFTACLSAFCCTFCLVLLVCGDGSASLPSPQDLLY